MVQSRSQDDLLWGIDPNVISNHISIIRDHVIAIITSAKGRADVMAGV